MREFRCRIRPGSVRPKPPTVQRLPVTPAFHFHNEAASEIGNILKGANECASASIAGYALVIAMSDGGVCVGAGFTEDADTDTEAWPDFVASSVSEHLNDEVEDGCDDPI